MFTRVSTPLPSFPSTHKRRDSVAEDGERVYSVQAYRAMAEANEPLFVVLRHDITNWVQKHEVCVVYS